VRLKKFKEKGKCFYKKVSDKRYAKTAKGSRGSNKNKRKQIIPSLDKRRLGYKKTPIKDFIPRSRRKKK